MRPLDALLAHPDESGVERQIEAGRAGAKHHHAATLDHKARDRKRLLAWMLEYDVDVLLAGDVPDRLAEFARSAMNAAYSGELTLGNWPQQSNSLRLMTPLAPSDITYSRLDFVRNDPDRVCARRRAQLHPEHPEPARSAPNQNVVAGLKPMRLVTEQHPICCRQRQRVGSAFLPGQVTRPLHQLAVLDTTELGEGAIGSLITPDALRGREHRIAAIAFLVVSVVLVAVDHDLVANLPARAPWRRPPRRRPEASEPAM